MKVIAKAPLRVSFFGGGTDILPFCRQYGGEILFSSINKYAYCEIDAIEDPKNLNNFEVEKLSLVKKG